MITIIIIELKGTIPDFLQSPHCVTNCLQWPGHSHVQYVKRLSHATCNVSFDTKGQLSYSVRQSCSCILF